MTATPIQTAAAQPAASVEITTPRWLAGAVVLVWLLGLALVVTSVVAVREQRSALDVIANQSAKSVIAAERMASALADMDANAANGLLSPQQKQSAIDGYNKSRGMMTDALVDAARNITFAGEEAEIKSLATASGVYGARVEAAFTFQNVNVPLAVAQYLKAAQLMDSSLLPAARKVDDINRSELNGSFENVGRLSYIQRALVWLTGIGMLAVLLRIQFFLSDRMRRSLNPLCLLATAVTAWLLLYTNHALSTAFHQVVVVKSDAFESVHLLWKTKAAAFEANAQESRYLLDKPGALNHQAYFDGVSKAISDDPAKLLATTSSTEERHPTGDMKGFLADELRNITFEGERDAAVKVVAWWVRYIEIDAKIRALERSGQHDQAVQLCLGEEDNQSNWAFKGFITALDKTLDINQREFDRATKSGFNVLKGFEILAPILGLIAALACLFGVLPRIREYSR